MKLIVVLIFDLIAIFSYAQTVVSLEPKVGEILDFSAEYIAKFNSAESFAKCMNVWEQMKKEGRRYNQVSPEEKEILKYCSEVREDVWDIVGSACSWYCGAGLGTIKASSYLKPQGDNNYNPSNAHDLSYKTAWVEGVSGYGIGEFLEYSFAPENPRINTVIIVNGYVKSKTSWENNSRVKKLNMYVDGKLFAMLNLKDVMAPQRFSISPIGISDRKNWESLKLKNEWKVKFEIAEVYEGAKYDDVAITEIYFDGLDVHCFGKGTEIRLADNSNKYIEDLKIGDTVLSYNSYLNIFEPAKILELASPIHDNLIRIRFKDGSDLVTTADHPFYDGYNWRSFNPAKTIKAYNFNNVLQLNPGDKLKSVSSYYEIVDIEEENGQRQTFTIVKLDRNNAFLANNVIVGSEELRLPTLCKVHTFLSTQE